MSADELIRQLTNMVFVPVAIAVALSALRQPTRPQVDAALFFGALAIVIVEGQLVAALAIDLPEIARDVVVAVVIALPYLLLRLLDDLATVPTQIRLAALAGLVLLVAGVLVTPTPLPAPLTLGVVAYFGVIQLYAAVVFVRESRRSAGLPRRRLQAAAPGSLLLGLTIALAGVRLAVPLPDAATKPIDRERLSAWLRQIADRTPGTAGPRRTIDR